jgi:hypothetical protein
MARGTTIKIGGIEYWLVYNAEAFFRVQEELGEDVAKKIVSPGRDGWETTIAAAIIMLEYGELCRRYLGYDAQKIPTSDDLRIAVQPSDIVIFKNKVIDAMNKGFYREVESQEEVDEGLLELEKKTEIA